MRKFKNLALVGALLLGLMGSRLLSADATVNNTTVLWNFINGIQIAGVSFSSIASGVMSLGSSSLTSLVMTASTGVRTLDAVGSRQTMPAVEVIASAATITANACGGVKRLSAAGAVTTNTTDTFTAPSSANAGCHMVVCNVDDTDTITLDVNTNFKALGGANIALTAFDCTQVFSDGTFWYSVGSLVAN